MYAVINQSTGLSLKDNYETANEAANAIHRMCHDWSSQGFPTTTDEFEVVEESQVDRSPRRHWTRSRRSTHAPIPPGMMRYPFPLNDGRVCYLTLPVDLTSDECDRLKAMIATLPVDEPQPSR